MKNLSIIFFLLVTTLNLQAGIHIDELDFDAEKAHIQFSGDVFTIVFNNDELYDGHSTIRLTELNTLSYKTRVMRYFGGLLRNNTYDFKQLRIDDGKEVHEFEFNRENISTIVNLMCRKFETTDNQ
ncbi:MAG: hypothetical protein JJU28_13940 [Cyclobacteriaceae bacterium]|nr:hypothetical protein [Cyclobacteriaceae bacterium]